MENILEQSTNLSNEIYNSKCYKDYINAKAKLEKDEEMYGNFLEFRKLQINNRKNLSDKETPFDTIKYLSKLQSDLMLNDIVRDFFICKREFLDLYNKVTTIVYSKLNFDFMEA